MSQLSSTPVDSVYENDLHAWHQEKESALRDAEGWLKLAGLFWLHEGANTIGAASDDDIVLPAQSAPDEIGTLYLHAGEVKFTSANNVSVTIDGDIQTESILKDDTSESGASRLKIGAITFFVIKREDRFGVRVIDDNHPALQTFTGRKWFPANAELRATATFTLYPEKRSLTVVNSVGMSVPMNNPGYVTFTLNKTQLRLDAFEDEPRSLWFVFKDTTNGISTYRPGRFLKAPFSEDGTVDLDFNKAYNPPCAFTPFATCPYPPRENHLPISIEAGEMSI